jgi:hypothetical protein
MSWGFDGSVTAAIRKINLQTRHGRDGPAIGGPGFYGCNPANMPHGISVIMPSKLMRCLSYGA